MQTGRETFSPRNHSNIKHSEIVAAVYAQTKFKQQSDGIRLCVAGLLSVWCVSTGELLKSIPLHESIRSLSTTIDGQCAVVCRQFIKSSVKLLKEDTLNVNEVNFGGAEDVRCVVATGSV